MSTKFVSIFGAFDGDTFATYPHISKIFWGMVTENTIASIHKSYSIYILRHIFDMEMVANTYERKIYENQLQYISKLKRCYHNIHKVKMFVLNHDDLFLSIFFKYTSFVNLISHSLYEMKYNNIVEISYIYSIRYNYLITELLTFIDTMIKESTLTYIKYDRLIFFLEFIENIIRECEIYMILFENKNIYDVAIQLTYLISKLRVYFHTIRKNAYEFNVSFIRQVCDNFDETNIISLIQYYETKLQYTDDDEKRKYYIYCHESYKEYHNMQKEWEMLLLWKDQQLYDVQTRIFDEEFDNEYGLYYRY